VNADVWPKSYGSPTSPSPRGWIPGAKLHSGARAGENEIRGCVGGLDCGGGVGSSSPPKHQIAIVVPRNNQIEQTRKQPATQALQNLPSSRKKGGQTKKQTTAPLLAAPDRPPKVTNKERWGKVPTAGLPAGQEHLQLQLQLQAEPPSQVTTSMGKASLNEQSLTEWERKKIK
jgi:hypothetical protein